MLNSEKNVESLIAENKKLKTALSRLIPWAGSSPDDPDWATPEAKLRNQQMCDDAIANANSCFPVGYNGFTDEDCETSVSRDRLN
ncbi:MAG: hypothetical protein ABSC42_00845 [Tepidisphaeraceae bacterium]|jgi:hypothetical protein